MACSPRGGRAAPEGVGEGQVQGFSLCKSRASSCRAWCPLLGWHGLASCDSSSEGLARRRREGGRGLGPAEGVVQAETTCDPVWCGLCPQRLVPLRPVVPLQADWRSGAALPAPGPGARGCCRDRLWDGVSAGRGAALGLSPVPVQGGSVWTVSCLQTW